MQPLRALARRRRHLALALVVLALAMKALIPSGYMIGGHSLSLTVQVCSDATHGATRQTITIPVVGSSEHDADKGSKADGICPFGALSMASLGAVDFVLAIAALAFIVAHGIDAVPLLRLGSVRHLRPPLRGPPVLA